MFSVGATDVKGLQRFENLLGAIGDKAPRAVNRAVARAGDMARTQVIKTLAVQTGLQQDGAATKDYPGHNACIAPC